MNKVKETAAYRMEFDVRDGSFDAAFFKLFNASSDLITVSGLEDDTLLDANESFLRVDRLRTR